MKNLAANFFHTPDGKLKSVPQRGLPHMKLYPARQKGRGGELMVKSLAARLKKPEIKSFGRIMLSHYLTQDRRVYGATGFDSVTGEFFVFKAQAVIAATGMGGWKTSYGKNTPTGEGLLMAYEIGCDLQDFEFCRVWNMPRHFAWEGQTHLFPLGARFVNRLGENFMSKYSPILGPNTDPHYTTIGMALEIVAGRGPIIFDVSPVKEEDMVLLKPQTGWQKLNYDKLRKLGMDFFKDDTEWVPQATVSYGSICSGIDGATNIAGLYAAGTAKSLEPGVYAGGFALMTTAVTGYMAGAAAAQWIKEAAAELPGLSASELDKLAADCFAPMGKEKGLEPKTILTKIQAAIFPYNVTICKTASALEAALEKIRKIRAEEIPAMRCADPHGLLKLREVEAIAFVSELYCLASLKRSETRAGHYRADFPTRNPNQLAWIIIKRGTDSKPTLEWKKVPVEKYPVPVSKFYQDNFTFPANASA